MNAIVAVEKGGLEELCREGAGINGLNCNGIKLGVGENVRELMSLKKNSLDFIVDDIALIFNIEKGLPANKVGFYFSVKGYDGVLVKFEYSPSDKNVNFICTIDQQNKSVDLLNKLMNLSEFNENNTNTAQFLEEFKSVFSKRIAEVDIAFIEKSGQSKRVNDKNYVDSQTNDYIEIKPDQRKKEEYMEQAKHYAEIYEGTFFDLGETIGEKTEEKSVFYIHVENKILENNGSIILVIGGIVRKVRFTYTISKGSYNDTSDRNKSAQKVKINSIGVVGGKKRHERESMKDFGNGSSKLQELEKIIQNSILNIGKFNPLVISD